MTQPPAVLRTRGQSEREGPVLRTQGSVREGVTQPPAVLRTRGGEEAHSTPRPQRCSQVKKAVKADKKTNERK